MTETTESKAKSMISFLLHRYGISLLAILVGTGILVWGLAKDSQITDLTQHGVAVHYTISSCDYQRTAIGTGGLECSGSFVFRGHTYSEDLSGVLNAPNDGAVVRALVDPRTPGAFVYIRSAIIGPNAVGISPETPGGIIVIVIGAGVGIRIAYKHRRNGLSREAAKDRDSLTVHLPKK